MLRRLGFWISYPFVVLAFKWREHKAWRRIVPRRWLSPSEIIAEDLSLFEPRDKIDLKLVEDFAKARDDILGLAKKQMVFSAIAFAFLLTTYLDVGLDISVAGFSLRHGRGIPEGLLLVSNMLSCYTLILQGNATVLDATIKSAIRIALPEELKTLYLVRYFPHEQFGRYQPFNMPYMIPNRLQRVIGRVTALLFLALLVFTYIAFSACNLFLLIHYLWIKPSFGIWSTALFVYILILGLGAFLYLILTRFKLPYLDYTINDEIELLQQINPIRHRARLDEIYGPFNAERRNMRERGYFEPRNG